MDGGMGNPNDLSALLPILIVLVVVAVIIAGVYFSSLRRKALAQLAASLGCAFSADDPFDIVSTYECFGCLDQGHSRSAYNVIWGQWGGVDFKAFDYHYATGSGKSRCDHYLSAVIVDTKLPMKPISIRPEGFLDHVAGMLGFEDIDFEWDEFNRAFYVKSPDKQFAYDVINQKMMEFLIQNRGWCLQVVGPSLIVEKGDTFSAPEFQAALAFARDFLGLLPEYLADKLRSQ
jgi:hypothetical protein